MKGYCILRVEKIKHAGGVAVTLGHNTRERETVNANPERRNMNQLRGAKSVEEGMSRFRGLVGKDKKPRKNAVLCLDYLITASNKSLADKERTDYLNEALKWIHSRHGAENILQVAVHRDENTDAHMHVLVVPLALDKHKKLKLNASKWLDGKKKLSQMQTDFHAKVGSKFDLARGIEGSVAKHEKVKRFYSLVNEQGPVPKINIPKPPAFGLIYDLEAWKKNTEKLVIKQLKPITDTLSAQGSKLVITERELYNTKLTLQKTEAENRGLRAENSRIREILTEAPLSEIQRLRYEASKVQSKQQQQARNRSKGDRELDR